MNCEKSRELFVDYLGQELSKSESGDLQLHLKSCRGCRQELALLNSTKATLRLALPEEPMPQRLAFSFTKPPEQRGWQGWFRGRAAWVTATACFLVCVASLALFRTQVKIGSTGVEISFGPSAVAAPAPTPAGGFAVANNAGLKKEEIQKLINEGLKQAEQVQNARFQQVVLQAQQNWQAIRSQDLLQINADLRYLEANQRSLVQDSARNSTFVQSLARNFYAKADAPGTIQ